jgi:hypothetical protein
MQPVDIKYFSLPANQTTVQLILDNFPMRVEFSGGVLGPLSVSAGGDTDIWKTLNFPTGRKRRLIPTTFHWGCATVSDRNSEKPVAIGGRCAIAPAPFL